MHNRLYNKCNILIIIINNMYYCGGDTYLRLSTCVLYSIAVPGGKFSIRRRVSLMRAVLA